MEGKPSCFEVVFLIVNGGYRDYPIAASKVYYVTTAISNQALTSYI